MNTPQQIVDKLIEQVEKYDCAHCEDSPIGSYYHDKEAMVSLILKNTIEALETQKINFLMTDKKAEQELWKEIELYQQALKLLEG